VSGEAEAADARRNDPLRLATPRIDDVEARRARAAVESRLFPGSTDALRVGRYRILGRIGHGGMGVVYRAHDPELARDVAVKLMNAEALDEDETATARTRLVREARAMARLAHPNVIHVYDVGAVEDGVFIAMELVDGESLASWLARGARDWREVLRRYVDAGRGLAAAHAAGVIHRDFKPENVLVGADGRVRVGDFGLAGAPALAGGPSFDDQRSADASLDAETVEGTLTRTGALLGTPKYMAPEQENGNVASATGDQFSFCVALYEGLFGHPPFEGETFAKYRKRVREGDVRPVPPDTRVPRWIHDAIVRGLAVEPVARHASMDVLLDELAQALVDPRAVRRGRIRGMLMVAPVILGAVAIGLVLGDRREREDEVPVAVAPSDPPAPEVKPKLVETPIAVPQPEPTPVVPAASTESPAVDASVATTKRTKPKPEATPDDATPKRGTCYFTEDEFNFISRNGGRKLKFVQQGDVCWDCRRAASGNIAFEPSDCRYNQICVKTDPESCGG